jgi:hypothetical protein
MIEVKDEREENQEQQEQPQEPQEIKEQQLNSFWDIAYVGEEEETKEVHMSQNVVTTRSERKNTLYETPNTYNPSTTTTYSTKQSLSPTNTIAPNIPKTTPSNHKEIDQASKPKFSPIAPKRLEYDFPEDLKKTKDNISLFELMKIPQIQENFIKTM